LDGGRATIAGGCCRVRPAGVVVIAQAAAGAAAWLTQVFGDVA
jgi:S-methylmethionine-dependent homocysteine/selenocysteine methylase